MAEERLQKILAKAGIGSRRDNELLIQAGRVRVNGVIAQLGSKADPAIDKISVDGKPIPAFENLIYIALYKPRGYISSADSEDGRQTVRDLIPVGEHIYPVGRLDFDSEGLILLTNDGEMANCLTHPRYGHEKEYRVLVGVKPDPSQLETWRRGVVLESGYKTAPAKVEIESDAGKGAWLRIVLKEGKKRQIRETGEQIGLPVIRIMRIRIDTLQIGDLKPKEWRYLTEKEIDSLKTRCGMLNTRKSSQVVPGRTQRKIPKTSEARNQKEFPFRKRFPSRSSK